jgi:hypothetical protein
MRSDFHQTELERLIQERQKQADEFNYFNSIIQELKASEKLSKRQVLKQYPFLYRAWFYAKINIKGLNTLIEIERTVLNEKTNRTRL